MITEPADRRFYRASGLVQRGRSASGAAGRLQRRVGPAHDYSSLSVKHQRFFAMKSPRRPSIELTSADLAK